MARFALMDADDELDELIVRLRKAVTASAPARSKDWVMPCPRGTTERKVAVGRLCQPGLRAGGALGASWTTADGGLVEVAVDGVPLRNVAPTDK